MEMHKVKSSNIDEIGWDLGNFEVKFKSGETYRFFKVPHFHFRRMLEGSKNPSYSVGSYFNTEIKHSFKYEKLPVDYKPEVSAREYSKKLTQQLKDKGLIREETDESGNTRLVVYKENFVSILEQTILQAKVA